MGEGFRVLTEGQTVSFEEIERDGKPEAADVVVSASATSRQKQ